MPQPKRERDLRRKYGITLDMYEALAAAQAYRCAICHSPPKPNRALAVDHCHNTGTVRGLLCDRCNTALGTLGDTPKALTAVLAYLLEHV